MSNLPPNPYNRTKIVEPSIDNPDRAPLGGTGKDFVVTLTDTTETPGSEQQFLSRTGKWVTFSTTTAPVWGGIVGNIEDQADLMALLDQKADISELAPVAFTGSYTSLTNKPPLGTVSPINLNGLTSYFLRGDGNWAIPTNVYTTWGQINGTITNQTDLMDMFNSKADVANPLFTGLVRAPTPPVDSNDTTVPTTAWFMGQAFNGVPQMDGVAVSGASTRWARGDHRHPSDTTKISDAPADGNQYARKDNAWSVVVSSGGSGGAILNYSFNVNPAPPPNSGFIRLNNVTQTAATLMYVNYTNGDGVDIKTFLLERVEPNDTIYIQDKNTSSKWQIFRVTGAVVDSGAYASIPVIWQAGGSALTVGAVIVQRESSASSGANVYTVGATWSGGGAAVALPTDDISVVCENSGTITAATILTKGGSGSCVVDVWKAPYVSYPPTVANSITSLTPPTVAGGLKSRDVTLTGWTKTVTAGDVVTFHLVSSSTFTTLTIELEITP